MPEDDTANARPPTVADHDDSPIDSEDFRTALRVLSPIFSRPDIITINKALHAAHFPALAPHWDRLLVLAPDWLREQYPRWSTIWLTGFDEDTLIDILSVAQADCCSLIEQMASALPRARLHEVCAPHFPYWFKLPLDHLSPRSLIDQLWPHARIGSSASELRLWLNWHLLHASHQAEQDHSLMLGAIDAHPADLSDPAPFLHLILEQLRSGESIDPAQLASQCRSTTQFDHLNSAQLHQSIRTWIAAQVPQEHALPFLTAVEAQALTAPSAERFFRQVMAQATRGEPVDLEACAEITSSGDGATPTDDANMPATLPSLAQADIRDTPAHLTDIAAKASPLPELVRQALPQRLADAMLRADLSALDLIWPEIVKYHAALLGQAAQRYLHRDETRQKLLSGPEGAKMKDVLAAMSASASRLIEPLWQHSAQLGALLPTPVAADEFQRQLLRFSYAEVMDKPVPLDVSAWTLGALKAVYASPTRPPDMDAIVRLAQTWHEALRGVSNSPLSLALARIVHGKACREAVQSAAADGVRHLLIAELCEHHADLLDTVLPVDAPEPMSLSDDEWHTIAQARAPQPPQMAQASTSPQPAIAILLMRAAAPDAAAYAAIALLTDRLIAEARAHESYAALPSALAGLPAIERVTTALAAPTLARLLTILRPELAAYLPSALRALSGILPVPLPGAPATLDQATWRAIYEAIFAGPTPRNATALLHAIAQRLASNDPTAQACNLGQAARTLTLDGRPQAPPSAAQAMTALLQPLAMPVIKSSPVRAARADDEAAPWTGDANLRNAGLAIVATYVQRLFNLLDITRDGQFVSDDARQRGVHLLQYIVTAEESTPEYQLSLNKLLCGIPAAVPIALGITITQQEKDTIEQMLNGVITHWRAIGSSSIAGLRETFLQREGTLYYQDDAWHLKVPQRTFDMLLDRLPWGYSLIKFPWMPAPLNVAWR